MTLPPKPPQFHPEFAPVDVEVRFVEFLADRPAITPRSIFAHTNGARGEGSIESAWNWAHARPNRNTCPHYQVDRTGRARKMLPSNRRGIANATVNEYEGEHGDVSWWSLAIETADTGTNDDPTISAFTPAQAERVAEIIAHESIVHGFPLEIISEWHGAGVASHTDPFGYPYTTLYRGKICPGDKKKAQVRSLVLPRAREIAAAWTFSTPPASPPTTTEIPDMWLIAKTVNDGPHFAAPRLGGPRYHVSTQCPRLYPFADNDSRKAFDIGSGEIVATWIECVPTTEAVIAQYMGE